MARGNQRDKAREKNQKDMAGQKKKNTVRLSHTSAAFVWESSSTGLMEVVKASYPGYAHQAGSKDAKLRANRFLLQIRDMARIDKALLIHLLANRYRVRSHERATSSHHAPETR